MKNKRITYISAILSGVAFVVFAWIRLVVQNADLLYSLQEQCFWQPGSAYLDQLVAEPKVGGYLSWMGQYLTQYFYYPALGASILIALWLVIYALWAYALKLKWYLNWLPLLLPLLLLFHVTSIGYFLYISKAPDWCFTPTLMCLCGSILLGLLALFIGTKARYASIVVLLGMGIFMFQWNEQNEIPASLRRPFCGMQDDVNFRAELRMAKAMEEAHWQELLTDMRHASKNPTRAMWMMKNVALLNQHRLTTDWLEYPCMTLLPARRDSVIVPLVESSGPLIYFMHGSVEFAYRWSMENMVEFGPSMGRLRLMIRCALVKGEWDLADKYLSMLEKTTFQKEWAQKQRRYIKHPELLADDPSYKLAYKMSESITNILDADQSHLENYLISAYVLFHSHNCHELSELSLICALQSQDIKNFWNQFFQYAHLNEGKPMPLLLQQAAYLFIRLEPQSAVRKDFPFDPKVPELYNKFQTRVQQLSAKGYSEADLPMAMQREFGNSYYWFYFFCRHLDTY